MSNQRQTDKNDPAQTAGGAADHGDAQPKLEQQASVQSNSGEMIKDVWLDNFFPTMEKISKLIDDYSYISMDTEYPGTVYVPPNTQNEFEYQMIRGNCDNLKLIQVGIALSNDKGDTPRGSTFAWQFNLQFDHENEQSINESMQLLRESGFEFEKHKTDGIPHKLFAEYLISSGLVLNQRNHWITFHGSGDFGYVLRILLGHNLPNLQDDFLNQLDSYFCNYYDCKEIKREIDVSGGLVKLAKELDVERVGTMHQAGSDAYVTCKVFFRLRNKLKQLWLVESEAKIEERFRGKIYGIGDSYNDDNYIESYKHCAKKSQYIDSTGYVNLRLLQQGYSTQNNNQSNSNQNHSASNNNPGSAHGLLQTGLNMGIPVENTGRNSANFMQHNQNTPHQWMQNNIGSSHGMLNSGNATNNMNSLNNAGHVHSHTPDMSAQFSNQFMMPNNSLDMNNINQSNLLSQMNLNGLNSFTPQTLNMNTMNQSQHQHNQQNINVIQQMNYLGSNQNLMTNSNSLGTSSMDDDSMGQPNSQYMMNRMQQSNSGGYQNHLNINSFQHMMNNNTQSGNQLHGQQHAQGPKTQFGYPQQYHQQLLDASGNHSSGTQNYGGRPGQPHPSSSPNLMGQGAPAANSFNSHMMNQHHQMNNHQMSQQMQQQQQQQNNYYGGQSQGY